MTNRHEAAPATGLQVRAAADHPDDAALLRRAGLRPSPQRLLVLRALAEGAHVTAEDALAHARADYPAINASTVYRTLEALERAGIVRRCDLGGPSRHFERARAHAHHHAVCDRCGAVAHFHTDRLRALARDLAEATGFRLLRDRELVIHGLCPACAGTPPAGRPTPPEGP